MGSLFTLVGIEVLVYLLRSSLGDGSSLDMTAEEVSFLFSTSIIPPLPQYILSASCSSVVVLLSCLYFSERFADSRLHKLLYQTGQLSLTLYVAHVILGMGTLEALGRLNHQSIEFALFSALIFCSLGMMFSALWLSYFKSGPLEWLFRKLAS